MKNNADYLVCSVWPVGLMFKVTHLISTYMGKDICLPIG